MLLRIDPAANQVTDEYRPMEEIASINGSIAVGQGAAWISAYNTEKVWRMPLP